eukprot:2553467-Rhodomonas_salina.3
MFSQLTVGTGSIEDTVARVNAALRALTYLSPENSNDEVGEPLLFILVVSVASISSASGLMDELVQFEKATLGAGQIVLNVTDNGSGGEYPYNKSFSHILAVNMTTVIANDPPIPIMPRSVSIFQNGSASVLGGHIVDVDMWQHQRRRYESRLTMNQVLPVKLGRCCEGVPMSTRSDVAWLCRARFPSGCSGATARFASTNLSPLEPPSGSTS